MTNAEISQAILNINPKAEFVLRGDDLTGLEWLGKDKAPTEAAILAEIELLPQRQVEKVAAKDAILAKLGLTAEEAKLLLA
jgi:hypothetical protein